MSDADKLFAAICKNPKNFARYLVYADLLEEQGKTVEAECWRLLGTFGKYPQRIPPRRVDDPLHMLNSNQSYDWWNGSYKWSDRVFHSCQLNEEWIARLHRLRRGESVPFCHKSGSISVAFDKAIDAYRRMRPTTRRKCQIWFDMANKGRTG